MGKDADVDAFGGADEAVEVAAEAALPPAVSAAVADIDLSDATLAGEAQDSVDGVFAIEFDDFGAFGAGGYETVADLLALVGGPFGAVEVNCDELAVKAVAVACAAGQHAGGVGARREPNGDAFLRAPELLDAVAGHVAFELFINDVGGEEQGDFA